jgi:starch phosphorylase
VEIRDAVGADNFFLFGLTAEQVGQARANGYNPRAIYERNENLHAVIDFVRSGALAAGDTALFAPIVEDLLTYDPYMVLEDFASYVETERRAADLWQDASSWTRMSILNVARVGHFSSDRSSREYCERVWHARPVLTRPHEPA